MNTPTLYGIMCRFDPILNRVWVTKNARQLTRTKKLAFKTADKAEADKLRDELAAGSPDYEFVVRTHTPGKKR